MNEVLSVLNNHKSTRKYTSEDITDLQLETIIKAAQSGPTWGNSQQLSIVGVRDDSTRKKIAELTGGQHWIEEAPVFLSFNMDFYRISEALKHNGQEFVAKDNVDTLLVGSTDVGIAMGFAIAAAESMGLGVVPIGAIRARTVEIIELLGLPEYVFPIAGLVIGHPAEQTNVKPRLPYNSFFHQETYNTEQLPYIEEYEKTYTEYLKHRENYLPTKTWTGGVAAYFAREQGLPKSSEVLKKQKFSYK
ncbi:NADPH-dependent oxidoreductase [Paenibacillus sp. LS1]|uniref:NADPH-dependent oxidoreductase n=1 Tax=Paenibacillus sp. LS1 TaxID=2992120 RepID=UPI0022322CF2|nr:NADPH-dependent oxidoreductase [Paenibacillus sp. LS1]MCW3794438.1 NADPH-dependent oxidoreductase [Paenibacillus sp. LS1]